MEISIDDYIAYCVESMVYPASNLDPYDYMPGDINNMYLPDGKAFINIDI